MNRLFLWTWQHCGFQNDFMGNSLIALDLGDLDAEASRGHVHYYGAFG